MNLFLLVALVAVACVLATLLCCNYYFHKQVTKLQAVIHELKAEQLRLQEGVLVRDENVKARERSLEAWDIRIQKEFSALADGVLERKARQFNVQQEDKLNMMLTPLKETIAHFKQDIDTKFSEENQAKASLKEEIVKLMSANQNISKQAQDLSQALKGSFKKQGDWGEGILDSILDYAGLKEGINFLRQAEQVNDAGIRIRPDIRVLLPQDRTLIIDSKVSLNHYWDYCSAETVDSQQSLAGNLVKAIRSHVDSLCEKKYVEIEGTPDFLIMFMPVEPAYILAMQHDAALWQYAYGKKIVLISPTNLIPAMKMISDMWRQEAVNKSAQMIAVQAGKLYDKLAGFIETFERAGKQLAAAVTSYDESRKQLVTGKGSLVSQAEKLRSYQLGTRKTISPSFSAEAQENDALGRFLEPDSDTGF